MATVGSQGMQTSGMWNVCGWYCSGHSSFMDSAVSRYSAASVVHPAISSVLLPYFSPTVYHTDSAAQAGPGWDWG